MDIRIKSKLWLEIGRRPVFGKGRMSLLEGIDRYGSINRAAKHVNISYRKAWGYIKTMEERFEVKLVQRQTGGRNGGGTTLTEEAREFMRKFEELEHGVREMVDERFRNIFESDEL